MRLLNRHRLWHVAIDAALVALAWWLAWQLRFDLEPWKRSMRMRSASSGSFSPTRPPSPSAKRFFVG